MRRFGLFLFIGWIGTALVFSASSGPQARILLIKTNDKVQITSTLPFQIEAADFSKQFPAREWVTLRTSRKGVQVGRTVVRGSVQIQPDVDGFLQLNKKRYRGGLTVRLVKNMLYVINTISVDDYLQGVVPREVPADWPLESLKAQAIVSRTFAMANRGQYEKLGYDLGADYFSQVYGGLDSENPATNQAVQETSGKILLDANRKPIQAYFHSSCGGRTEASTAVWSLSGVAPPYLKGIDDGQYCQDDPHYRWSVKVAASFLQRKLEKAGYKTGAIKSLDISEESASGRARMIRIEGKKKTAKLSGHKLRLMIGPENVRSTYFEKIEPAGSYFRFIGRGWGHGVGLCQWGARGRALDGQTAESILNAYYPGAEIGTLP